MSRYLDIHKKKIKTQEFSARLPAFGGKTRNLVSRLFRNAALKKGFAVFAVITTTAGGFPLIANAIEAPEPAPNPELLESCGLDVALVLDNSGSVGADLTTMKNAFKDFVDALLPGTQTQFSVTYFNSAAHYTQEVFSDDAATTKSAIDAVPDAGGATNWVDGLSDANAIFDPRLDVPNMIVFSSDGNPNKPLGDGNGFEQVDLDAAVTEANVIKGEGTRIITLGIGAEADLQAHMEAISSADAYYSTANFDTLAGTLEEIVNDLCGGTITAHKIID